MQLSDGRLYVQVDNPEGSYAQAPIETSAESGCSVNLCLDIIESTLPEGMSLIIRGGGNTLYNLELEPNAQNCFENLILPGQITMEIHTTMPGTYWIDNVTLHRRCQEFEHYAAQVRSAQDYYPFGSIMPGRVFNSGDHNYGFNGKLKDDEIKGSGNSYDFGARIYDPRVARFLSLDPRMKEFPHFSPYLFAANNPIKFIDVNGEGPAKGPFSDAGRVSETQFGIKVLRVTTSDRVAMNVYASFVLSATGPVGAAVGVGKSGYDAFNGGNAEKQKFATDYGRELTLYSVEKYGTQAGSALAKGLGKGFAGFELYQTAKDNAPTRQETLEDYVFQIAKKSYGFKSPAGSDNKIVLFNKEVTREDAVNFLNTAYNVLEEELGDYDLTTDEGITKATEYISNNYKDIKDKITNKTYENESTSDD